MSPIRTRRSRAAIDSDLDDEAVERAIAFLRTKLSPADLADLKTILRAGKGEEMGEDEPPPFKGMPKPGGTMVAADARGNSYNDRFPDAARIKVWL